MSITLSTIAPILFLSTPERRLISGSRYYRALSVCRRSILVLSVTSNLLPPSRAAPRARAAHSLPPTPVRVSLPCLTLSYRGAPARIRAWRCEGRPPLPHHFVCVETFTYLPYLILPEKGNPRVSTSDDRSPRHSKCNKAQCGAWPWVEE